MTKDEKTPVSAWAGDIQWNRSRIRQIVVRCLSYYPELLVIGLMLWLMLQARAAFADSPGVQAAWLEFVGGRFEAAESMLLEASDDPAAQRLLTEVRLALCRQHYGRASELFRRGYLIENSRPETAKKLYDAAATLLASCASSSSTAKSLLERLQARQSKL